MDKKRYEIMGIVGDTVGAAITAGIGCAIAGPGGAILGTVLGSIGGDVLSRLLSKKEKERVDRACSAAASKIEENEKCGRHLRDDDFFENVDNDRSTAEEVYEGILLAAQKEYEEKKIELLGCLFANIAYDSSITRSIANGLIKEASELSYQQLKIIKAVGVLQQSAALGDDLRRDNTTMEVRGLINVTIASDILILYHKSLVHSSEAILDAAGIKPSRLSLVGRGAHLFNLMELSKVENDDVEKAVMDFLTSDKIQ